MDNFINKVKNEVVFHESLSSNDLESEQFDEDLHDIEIKTENEYQKKI